MWARHWGPYLLHPEHPEHVVGDELDVLAHEGTVDADERGRERVAELALDVDGVGDDLADAGLVQLVVEAERPGGGGGDEDGEGGRGRIRRWSSH